MDPVEVLAIVERMEGYINRGIQIEVTHTNPAPLVLIRVTDPADHSLVPQITADALALFQANGPASSEEETEDPLNQ